MFFSKFSKEHFLFNNIFSFKQWRGEKFFKTHIKALTNPIEGDNFGRTNTFFLDRG